MNAGASYESTTEFSHQKRNDHKECMACGAEIREQFESILFECERCMNLQAE